MTGDANDKKLPTGWERARLGDVCVQDKTTVAPNDPVASTLKFIGLEHVESGSGRILPNGDGGKPILSNAYKFDSRHVLYGKLRPYLNKVATPDFAGRCTTELVPLLPAESVDRDWLAWYLRRPETVDFAMRGKTGSRMPRANMREFMGMEIPLPPLAEQRRVVARLNARIAVAERAKAAAREILEAADALNAAIVRDLIGHQLADFGKWAKLGEVSEIVNGSGFSLKYQGHTSLPIPFLKVSDMNTEGNERAISKSANTVDAQMLKDLKAKTCPAGSVIFPKVGGALLTNKKRILGRESAFDNNIMGVVPVDVSTEWLFYWLQTIDLPALANIQALPSIRSSVVKELKIPIPPLAEQRRIAALIDNQLAAARKLQSAARGGLDEIEAMPSALLRRAMGDDGG